MLQAGRGVGGSGLHGAGAVPAGAQQHASSAHSCLQLPCQIAGARSAERHWLLPEPLRGPEDAQPAIRAELSRGALSKSMPASEGAQKYNTCIGDPLFYQYSII